MQQKSLKTALYCVCREPYDKTFMIECDNCSEWFHGRCVDITEAQAQSIKIYFCTDCQATKGPIQYLPQPRKSQRRATSVSYASDSGDEPSLPAMRAETATVAQPDYLERLKKRQFMRHEFTELEGAQFTEDYVRRTGFKLPVLCRLSQGLGMVMPDSNITVAQIAQQIGNRPIEVMDVVKQESVPGWTLQMWSDYFMTVDKSRLPLLNVISMEFSDSKFGSSIKRPQIVRDLDLADIHWPAHKRNLEFPKVQLYCLMSPSGCWTDFHVDFGGTSVFYHILSGRKKFLLIPPDKQNLRAYERWCKSSDQSEVFFVDFVDICYEIDLEAGQTFFIPSGWIHAVYTGADSVVIGGNFLHKYAFEMQLTIYEIEERCEVPNAYRYPYFETLNWFSARDFSLKSSKNGLTQVELNGLSALHNYLSSRLYELRRSTLSSSKSIKYRERIDYIYKSLPEGFFLEASNILGRLKSILNGGLTTKRQYVSDNEAVPQNIQQLVKRSLVSSGIVIKLPARVEKVD